MKFSKPILAALGILIVAGSALSEAHPVNVNRRQVHQDARIYQGIHNGTITRHEAAILNRRNDRIDRMENRFRSDGNLSFKERAKLQHALNQNSRFIYRQKHDPQRVGRYRF